MPNNRPIKNPLSFQGKRYIPADRELCANGHSWKENLRIRKNGNHGCRECDNETQRRRRAWLRVRKTSKIKVIEVPGRVRSRTDYPCL